MSLSPDAEEHPFVPAEACDPDFAKNWIPAFAGMTEVLPLDQTLHASAVLVGAKAVLIRGASGAGKSRLAWQLLQSGLAFTRLIGDDRVQLEGRGGRLLVRPAATLAGLIEIRGLGIRRVDYEPVAVLGLVVDLGAPIRTVALHRARIRPFWRGSHCRDWRLQRGLTRSR